MLYETAKCSHPRNVIYPKINQDNKLMNWGRGEGGGGGYHQLNSRNFYTLSKSCNCAVLIWKVVLLISLSLKLVHLDFPHHDTTINHIT